MRFSRRDFVKTLSAGSVASVAASAVSATIVTPSNPEAPKNAQELHRLIPVSARHVTIGDEFWSPKLRTWQEVTIRDCFRKFESDGGGALNNFDKVRDGHVGGHAGPPWADGLIYEMIRSAADFLVIKPDGELEAQLDGYITRISAAAAKHPDGYLNTYTQLDEPGHEWGLNGGLQIWQHEIYNAGALVDAGIHYYRATGKTVLLTTGVKFANHMANLMGPAPKKNLVPCHSLPEEALIKLYLLFREEPQLKGKVPASVAEQAYLSLAEFWIENRGNNIGKPDWDKDRHAAELFVREGKYGNGRPSWGAYAQDDKSVFEQETIHGHAVRATLLCAGIAAAANVNGRREYIDTADRLWNNMVGKRMHITGGVGAYAEEEKFGSDYALPNDAYLETCAAVGASFFHRNMNLAFGEARYADQLERTLYNGALSGVSLNGDSYFYMNPLEAGHDRTRWHWHECPCCPPMFLKLMGDLPNYIYSTDADSLYVNLFISGQAETTLKDRRLLVKQSSRYPWDGKIAITLHPASPVAFNLMIRIPGWCSNGTLQVNGEPVPTGDKVRGYTRIVKTWQEGDRVELQLPMPVEPVKAHPLVEADAGKIALTRGPLVYCLESADNGDNVKQLAVNSREKFTVDHKPDLMGGVTVITAPARLLNAPVWQGLLYASARAAREHARGELTAIPYYANANRGPVDMAVWLPEVTEPA